MSQNNGQKRKSQAAEVEDLTVEEGKAEEVKGGSFPRHWYFDKCDLKGES